MYERVIHLLREVEYAKSQLQPHDTGHISTAISWMESRINKIMTDIDKTPEPAPKDRPMWRENLQRKKAGMGELPTYERTWQEEH
jgi:hypothetical protein